MQQTEAESIRMEFPSLPEYLPRIKQSIERLTGKAGFDNESTQTLLITLCEAYSNAIRHGSPNGARDTVEINAYLNKDEVTVEVVDHGPGFDPSKTPELPNPEAEHGRGIFLMKSLLDHVNIYRRNGNGMTVELKMKRPVPARELEVQEKFIRGQKAMEISDVQVAELIQSIVDTLIKVDIVRFFNRNPYTRDTADNLAKYIGRETTTVKEAANSLCQKGLLACSKFDNTDIFFIKMQEKWNTVGRLIQLYENPEEKYKILYHLKSDT